MNLQVVHRRHAGVCSYKCGRHHFGASLMVLLLRFSVHRPRRSPSTAVPSAKHTRERHDTTGPHNRAPYTLPQHKDPQIIPRKAGPTAAGTKIQHQEVRHPPTELIAGWKGPSVPSPVRLSPTANAAKRPYVLRCNRHRRFTASVRPRPALLAPTRGRTKTRPEQVPHTIHPRQSGPHPISCATAYGRENLVFFPTDSGTSDLRGPQDHFFHSPQQPATTPGRVAQFDRYYHRSASSLQPRPRPGNPLPHLPDDRLYHPDVWSDRGSRRWDDRGARPGPGGRIHDLATQVNSANSAVRLLPVRERDDWLELEEWA